MGWYVNLEDYRYYCYCLTNSVFVKTLLMDSWQPITIMNKHSEDESQGITTKLTNLQLNLYFHLIWSFDSMSKMSTHTLSSCRCRCSASDDRPGSDVGCPWWWCSSRWRDRWKRLYASYCACRMKFVMNPLLWFEYSIAGTEGGDFMLHVKEIYK